MAVETFFPVSVLAADTVTPGNGVVPDLIMPRTMNCGVAKAGTVCADATAVGAGGWLRGAGDCAHMGTAIAKKQLANASPIPAR